MADRRERRHRADISPDTRQDQYFLEDSRVIERTIAYAHDAAFPFDHVLEIGPGTGALTAHLLDEATKLTVIERDLDLVAFLEREFAEAIQTGQLTIQAGDATADPLPSFDACISNLPYGVSSPLIFRLLPEQRPLLVMVQREFGERMAATPGSDAYGRLSVSAQHFGEIAVLEIVPPSVFTPQPAVDSAIVRVLPREPTYTVTDEAFFLDVTKAIFTQRRKTLRNALRNTTHISGIDDAAGVIDELPSDVLSQRPGVLSPATFAQIANIANRYRKHDER